VRRVPAAALRGAGKKIFMHSDGHTLDIYPDMVELELDAFNSQIFCMGVQELAPFAGKITFWGEIDRQHVDKCLSAAVRRSE